MHTENEQCFAFPRIYAEGGDRVGVRGAEEEDGAGGLSWVPAYKTPSNMAVGCGKMRSGAQF